MDDTIKRAILNSRSGTDYDIAKCFIIAFPNCSTFSDVQLSVTLSEDFWSMYCRASGDLHHQASTRDKYEDRDKLISIAERLLSTAAKLKSHTHKKRYIKEIKMLWQV